MKKMDTYKKFHEVSWSVFQQYLIKERGASQQTVRAYGEAFKAYLEYNKTLNIKPQNITLRNFTRFHISSFLNWIEEEKKNSISSRNQRLSAMRSFACFLIMDDPLHICQWIEVRQIPAKRGTTEIVKHLSVDGMAAILRQIDTSTPIGRRNLAMLSLLYNSGTRVQELIDLTPICIRFEKPYSVVVKGKGNKKRFGSFGWANNGTPKELSWWNRIVSSGKRKSSSFFQCTRWATIYSGSYLHHKKIRRYGSCWQSPTDSRKS